jgi:transcriptional regulator with XRE-family HTH domain
MKKAREFSGYHGVFAERLREAMDSNQKTQADLAKQIGMTRQAISTYMDGSVLPNIEKLYRICTYFDLPSDYFLGLTDSKSKDVGGQHLQAKTGLSLEALDTLEKIHHDVGLFAIKHPLANVKPFEYLLTSKRFVANFPERLRAYISTRKANEQADSRTSLYKDADEVEEARYTLARVFEKLVDEIYHDVYEKLPDYRISKQKPGRKRKEVVAGKDNDSSTPSE